MKRSPWLHGLISAENNVRAGGRMEDGMPDSLLEGDINKNMDEFMQGAIDYDNNCLARLKMESDKNGNI